MEPLGEKENYKLNQIFRKVKKQIKLDKRLPSIIISS